MDQRVARVDLEFDFHLVDATRSIHDVFVDLKRGISKLVELSGRRQAAISSQDIAFAVAPRINAAGRLQDMSIGVKTLLAEEPYGVAPHVRI